MKLAALATLPLCFACVSREPVAPIEPVVEPATDATDATEPLGQGRVIVIGVDGFDARTAEALMAMGQMPNMKRLVEMGSYSPLTPTVPVESPTSWASLNSGQNPAKTGVPGFVMRNLLNGSPSVGFGHLEMTSTDWDDLAERPSIQAEGLDEDNFGVDYPRFANPAETRNFWDYAADAGVQAIVLDSAQTFDQEGTEGVSILHGLGVPDARGGIGDWQIYSTEDTEFDRIPEEAGRYVRGRRTGTAGRVYRVDWEEFADGRGIASTYFGPKNFWLKDKLNSELRELRDRTRDAKLSYKASMEIRKELAPAIEALEQRIDNDSGIRHGVSVPLHIEERGDTFAISLGGETHLVADGDWSDFYHLTFPLNDELKVHGITRVKVLSAEPDFRLLINTLDIDPAQPSFWQPISSPPEFSVELSSTCAFETYGWPSLTMPLKDEEIAPETMIEDLEFTMKWREQLAFGQMQKADWGLFMAVFSTLDRAQHLLYHHYDEGHPLHNAEEAARKVEFFGEQVALKDIIPAMFCQVDRILGRVLDEVVKDGDVVLVCSDHGFQSFRYQVNMNNLLAELGFLAVSENSRPNGGRLDDYVDWTETYAYSMGLGNIYLNLAGREANGIVLPEQAATVLSDLSWALKVFVDPETDQQVVKDVYLLGELHEGEYADREADITLGFAPTYRISWRSTGGKISMSSDGELGPVIEDNTSQWSGGHPSVALEDVRGVFLSSVPLQLPESGVDVLHIGPTVLSLLNVEVPVEMDLAPLQRP